MHVLVTGGGGYLGCHVVSELLERGHWVRLFDRLCFGEEPIAAFAASPRCEIVRGDIRRLQEQPGLFDNIDCIIHLAGLTNDPSCDLDPEMTVDVNVESTKELASRAVQRDVRRFVFASTCAVYGKGVFEVLDEQSPTNPVSTFAASKLQAEHVLLPMKTGCFEPVVARAATLFGWSPRMRFDLAVNQMTATAVCSRRITVHGGGNQWRPVVHVRDAARALADLAEAPAAAVSGEVFNVGGDALNFRIGDLASRVAAVFNGVQVETARDDEDLRTYHVNFGKVRQRIGFAPQRSVEDGADEIREHILREKVNPFADIHFNVRRMRQLLATPVDEGGEPVAPHFIPMARPCLGPEEEQAAIEALRSGWLTSGPHVAAFEKAFAETVAACRAVAVSSCTAALHLCLVHLGLRPGDEVITSPLTWASTGNTMLAMGLRPVFADIDPATLNIAPDSVAKAITERTKVIMPVHLAGCPCDMDAIGNLARTHRLAVVEDAAHALGASYRGAPIGSLSEFSCFSFYAIKNITTMEGGIVTLKDESAANHLRLLAANGMAATAWERYGRSASAAPPEVVEPGFKYLMGNVSAAIGLEQLKKFASFKATRARLARMYRIVLADVEEISLPAVPDNVEHAWHLLIVRLKLDRLTKTRDEIAYALRRENIGTGVHFYGLHLHRYYREVLGMRPEDLPHATQASREILSLPLHPQMTDKNVHQVVEALKKVLAHALRRSSAG